MILLHLMSPLNEFHIFCFIEFPMILCRCLRGDWAGMDDPLAYNCSVAVAEARAAK